MTSGITGQDVADIRDLLLSKGYQVHGIRGKSSLINISRIDYLYRHINVESHRFSPDHGNLDKGLVQVYQKVVSKL